MCGFVYLTLLFREILMDISDVEGDKAAGVYTLPVVLGKRAAMAFGVACFGLGTAVMGTAVWFSSGVARLAMAMPALSGWAQPLALAGVGLITGPVYAEALQIARGGMWQPSLKAAVEGMLKPLGLGLLLWPLLLDS
eukprot:jgi/Botrbrau1/6294/Bobra.0339s0005.1